MMGMLATHTIHCLILRGDILVGIRDCNRYCWNLSFRTSLISIRERRKRDLGFFVRVVMFLKNEAVAILLWDATQTLGSTRFLDAIWM
jgi:hypothetical protein